MCPEQDSPPKNPSTIQFIKRQLMELLMDEICRDGRLDQSERGLLGTVFPLLVGTDGLLNEEVKQIKQRAIEKFQHGQLGEPLPLDPQSFYMRAVALVHAHPAHSSSPDLDGLVRSIGRHLGLSDEVEREIEQRVSGGQQLSQGALTPSPATQEGNVTRVVGGRVDTETKDEEQVTRIIDRRSPGMAWPLATVLVVLILAPIGACLYTGHSVVGGCRDGAAGIADKFFSVNITHTFKTEGPISVTPPGQPLEVAVVSSEETITKADERRACWDKLYVGTTITEIKVPATFRYHIKLMDDWQLRTKDNVCLVLAPKMHPTLPVAFNTAGMEKKVDGGWFRFDSKEQLAELEKSLTSLLEGRAGSHLASARESGRTAVAKFVKTWLLREDHWRTDRFHAIIVKFCDEVEEGKKIEEAFAEKSHTISLSEPSPKEGP